MLQILLLIERESVERGGAAVAGRRWRNRHRRHRRFCRHCRRRRRRRHRRLHRSGARVVGAEERITLVSAGALPAVLLCHGRRSHRHRDPSGGNVVGGGGEGLLRRRRRPGPRRWTVGRMRVRIRRQGQPGRSSFLSASPDQSAPVPFCSSPVK